MFKYIRKDKRGISLAELVIVVVIVGFVLSLAGQLLYSMTNVYNKAEQRWDVQNAVQLACNKFESGTDSIINSYKADLLYDISLFEDGMTYNTETGAISYRTTNQVMPTEGAVDNSNVYSYIFTALTYDQNGKELGYFMYYRAFDDANTSLLLDTEGFGEVPVKVSFRVASSVPLLKETAEGSFELKDEADQHYKYMDSTLEVFIESGKEDVSNYSMTTQYALNNFSGRSLTYDNGEYVLQQKWIGNAYPAGWMPVYKVDTNSTGGYVYAREGDTVLLDNGTNVVAGSGEGQTGELVNVTGGPEKNSQGQVKVRYFTAGNPPVYSTGAQAIDVTDYIYGEANMIRFLSERAAMAKGEIDQLTTSVKMASCLSNFLFADGSVSGGRVIGALHDFRDNVLKGTVVGDWIIDQYYNVWSPALIEQEWLHPILKVVIKSASYVCGTVANLN
ncbi:MAG: hypothetical protein K5761_08755 [Clostridiales bacterium]|nr:hypothetical protein [Clostridiales bacterium]